MPKSGRLIPPLKYPASEEGLVFNCIYVIEPPFSLYVRGSFLLSTRLFTSVISTALSAALLLFTLSIPAHAVPLEKPQLVSFTFTPNEIDQKSGPNQVDFTLTVSSPTGIYNQSATVNLVNSLGNINLIATLKRTDSPIVPSQTLVTFKGSLSIATNIPAGPLFMSVDNLYSLGLNGNKGYPNNTFYPSKVRELVGATTALLVRNNGILSYSYPTFIGPTYNDPNYLLPWVDPKFALASYPYWNVGEIFNPSDYFEVGVPNMPLLVRTTTPRVCSTDGKTMKFIAMGICDFTVYTAKTNDYLEYDFYSTADEYNNPIMFARSTFKLRAPSVPAQLTTSVGTRVTVASVYDYDGATIIYPQTLTPSVCHPTGVNVNIASVGTCKLQYVTLDGTFHGADTATVTFDIGTPQTINVSTVKKQTSINTPVKLEASASSGLPVTYSSQTPKVCDATLNTLVPIKKGICIVTVSQTGSSTYDPATQSVFVKIK